MSLIIETDIKEILNKLDQRFEKMDQRYERMDQSLNEIKLSQVELKGDIRLSTRVSNQELLLRTIVGGLVLIILGGAVKMFWNFPVNP
jgi:hypothetical protein